MNKNLLKKFLVYPLLLLVILNFLLITNFTYTAQAQSQYENMFGLQHAREVGLPEQAEPVSAVVSFIRLLLTFLSILALILILYGGFMWMTAAGNEERVEKAKKIITATIIGIVIIMAAFIIVSFILRQVPEHLGA